ncbi:MAG: YciC family protein [Candidatus Omnitrophota bacterium]
MALNRIFSISDCLGRSITAYRENFTLLLNFSLAASAPVVFRMLLQTTADEGLAALGMLLGPMVFCSYVFFFMCQVFVVSNSMQGQALGAKEVMGYVRARFLRLLGAYFLFTMVVFLGFFLLVIPGVYALTVLMFYPFIIMIEDKKLWDSFKRSYELVKGYFWPVLGANAAVFLISLALFIPVFIALRMMGSSDVILLIILGVMGTLTAPLFVIFYYLIYDALKIEKDGVLNIVQRSV